MSETIAYTLSDVNRRALDNKAIKRGGDSGLVAGEGGRLGANLYLDNFP
jgi:hypothetical protein